MKMCGETLRNRSFIELNIKISDSKFETFNLFSERPYFWEKNTDMLARFTVE